MSAPGSGDPAVPPAGEDEPDHLTGVLDTEQAGPRIIRGSALRAAGYLAGTVLSVVPAALLLRHLGVEDTGRYVTVLAVVAIAGGVFEAGITAVGVREASVRTGADRAHTLASLAGLRLTLTTAAMLLAVGFAVVAGYTSAMVAGTAVAGVGFLLLVAQQTYAVPLSAGLKLGSVAGLDLLRQALMAVGIISLVVAGAGLVPILGLSIPVGLVVGAVALVLARGLMPLLPAFDPRAWWELVRRVLPFAAASALSVLYFRLVVVLMSLLASEDETGLYGAAFRVLEVLNPLPALLVSAALPVLTRAARDDRHRLTYALDRLFQVALIVGVWMGIGLVLGAEFAIDVLAGPDFDGAVAVLQVQGLALAAFFVASVWAYGLLSLHRHRALLIGNVVAVVAVTGLSLALVPAAGAMGGAVALSAAEVLLAASFGILLVRSDRALRPRAGSIPAVIAAAGLALAVPLLLGLPSLPATVLGTVLFFGMLAATGAVPPEIRHAFAGRLGRRA